MTDWRSRAAFATIVLSIAVMLAACGTAPSPSGSAGPPATSEAAPPLQVVLGCIGIAEAECRFVAERVVEGVAVGRGAPFSLLIEAYCVAAEPCPETLDVRQGRATVEWADRGEPLAVDLAGPARGPVIVRQDMHWSGPHEPSSERVLGPGPFPLELGHCGLTWQVDFDGSFWVPTGQVDGDAPGLIDAGAGQIRLLGPNLAEFGVDGRSVQLARFPGPKHIWPCR